MLKRVNQLEYIFFGVALTLMMDSFYPIFQYYQTGLARPATVKAIPYKSPSLLVIYIVSLASFVLRPKSRRLLVAVPAILILLLVAVDSSVWSADPAVSLRRVFALAGTFAFAHYLMARLTFIEFVGLFVYRHSHHHRRQLYLSCHRPVRGDDGFARRSRPRRRLARGHRRQEQSRRALFPGLPLVLLSGGARQEGAALERHVGRPVAGDDFSGGIGDVARRGVFAVAVDVHRDVLRTPRAEYLFHRP